MYSEYRVPIWRIRVPGREVAALTVVFCRWLFIIRQQGTLPAASLKITDHDRNDASRHQRSLPHEAEPKRHNLV